MIPESPRSVTVSFDYYTVATGGDSDGDRQYALIIDEAGEYHYLLNLIWPDTNHDEWMTAQFSEAEHPWLLDLAGQTVTIHFETANNRWGGAAVMYVDNVSVVACPETVVGPVLAADRPSVSGRRR